MMIPSVNLLHLLVYGICFISVLNPVQGRAGAQTQVQTCVLPPFPEHGSYTSYDHPNAKPGDVVPENTFLSYSCQEGYDIDSWESPSCYEGKWTNVRKCLMRCTLPTVKSVKFRCQRNEATIECNDILKSGTILEADCITGYYAEEDLEQVGCDDGKWNKTIPVCKPAPIPHLVRRAGEEEDRSSACVIPPPPPHGSYHSYSRPTLPVGELGPSSMNIAYECDEGYDIAYSNFIHCNNGQWSHPPKCIERCDMPKSSTLKFRCVKDNQDVDCGNGKVRSETEVWPSCIKGYYTEKDPKPLKCTDGNWDSHVNTKCLKVHVRAPSDLTSGSSAKSIREEQELSNAMALFSQDFYKTVSSLHPNNLVTSPLSLNVALALLSLGALGATERELLAALHLPDAALTRATYPPTLQRLAALEGVALQIVNKVYVMEGPQYRLSPAYRKDAVDVFRAEIEGVNFANSAVAANTINSWVKQKTNGKITELFKESSLDSQTRVVLVNAVYFKGKWDKPFDPNETQKRSFHVSATETTQVDMMELDSSFRYTDLGDIGASALELPYRGGQVSMVILLPDKVDRLHEVEEAANYTRVLQALRRPQRDVIVQLPRFKIETSLNLQETLTKMGMGTMFSNGAELGGLLEGREPLKVGEAVQKAYIEVNEEGAEAAAATGLVAQLMCGGCGPDRFTVDRPFMFYLVGEGDTLLFSGRVTRP